MHSTFHALKVIMLLQSKCTKGPRLFCYQRSCDEHMIDGDFSRPGVRLLAFCPCSFYSINVVRDWSLELRILICRTSKWGNVLQHQQKDRNISVLTDLFSGTQCIIICLKGQYILRINCKIPCQPSASHILSHLCIRPEIARCWSDENLCEVSCSNSVHICTWTKIVQCNPQMCEVLKHSKQDNTTYSNRVQCRHGGM